MWCVEFQTPWAGKGRPGRGKGSLDSHAATLCGVLKFGPQSGMLRDASESDLGPQLVACGNAH